MKRFMILICVLIVGIGSYGYCWTNPDFAPLSTDIGPGREIAQIDSNNWITRTPLPEGRGGAVSCVMVQGGDTIHPDYGWKAGTFRPLLEI